MRRGTFLSEAITEAVVEAYLGYRLNLYGGDTEAAVEQSARWELETVVVPYAEQMADAVLAQFDAALANRPADEADEFHGLLGQLVDQTPRPKRWLRSVDRIDRLFGDWWRSSEKGLLSDKRFGPDVAATYEKGFQVLRRSCLLVGKRLPKLRRSESDASLTEIRQFTEEFPGLLNERFRSSNGPLRGRGTTIPTLTYRYWDLIFIGLAFLGLVGTLASF